MTLLFSMTESFKGYIKTLEDAMIVINKVEKNLLPLTMERISKSNGKLIESGNCYVWSSEKTSISRWTDGLYWSASRIHGHFLVYKQMESKIRLEDGLIKKTVSLTTLNKKKYHLVCYYKKSDIENLARPSESCSPTRQPIRDNPTHLLVDIGSWIDKNADMLNQCQISKNQICQLNKYLEL